MSDLLLQVWGGTFYLLNKVCFAKTERSFSRDKKRKWRIRSWIVYLLALPAWVMVFILNHNCIAAGVEAGAVPAMVVGLLIAWRGRRREPKSLETIAKFSVFSGISMSIYEFGGISQIHQILELGIASGFLMGTYFLAKDRISGYFWIMEGNVCCSVLMGIEGFYILMVQQVVSLIFVTDACRTKYIAARGKSISVKKIRAR